MDINEAVSKKKADGLLIYNPEYYSFIFKKTEKIVSAVFYITEGKKDKNTNTDTVSYIQNAAENALDAVLDALSREVVENGQIEAGAHKALLRLRSAFQIAHAAGIMRTDYVDVLTREIDDVIRNLHMMSTRDDRFSSLAFNEEREYADALRSQKLREPAKTASKVAKGLAGQTIVRERQTTERKVSAVSRRDAILSVLRSKGNASIKDISDVVLDCSEKTIQRELTDMINKGQVVREGERRWSRYRLAIE